MPRFNGIPVNNAGSGKAPRFKGIPVAPKTMVVQPNMMGVPAIGPLLAAIGYDGQAHEAPAGYEPSSVPILDPISTFANSTLNAIPIVGPTLKSAAERLDELTYGEAPGTRTKINAADAEQYKNAKMAGDFAGPTIALAPLGATALGGRLLGMTGGLASRVGLGGLSGALISGADAKARGQSNEDALRQVEFGAAGGVVLPILGAGFRAITRGVTGNTFDPAEKALARALDSDQIPVAEVQQRLDALGPDAVLADLGPNLQRQAGALASLPGEAQRIVRDALVNRANGTNSRIIGDVASTLGEAPVPSQIAAGIEENMRALAPQYRAAFENARAVDTTPIAQGLEADIVNMRGPAQQALRQVRSMLDIHGSPGILDPHPGALFETRQAIDGLLANEANPKVIGVLTDARRQIDTMLGEAVPGLKAVDARFEELARQREALQFGQQALESGRTAVRPVELQQQVAQGAVPERGMGPSAVPFRLSQGARAEIDRIIGTTTNDLNALKTALKGDGSWNRDRLVTLFGADRADRLLHVLERERTYADTAQIVTRNSETAARTAAQKEFETITPGDTMRATATGMVASALQRLATAGAGLRRSATNTAVARSLMSQQVPQGTLEAVARALAARAQPELLAPALVPLIANRASGW